jgi:DedD protein
VLDQNLKQRLVGAAVLITLAVVVIPLLLRGPAELSPNEEGAHGRKRLSPADTATKPSLVESRERVLEQEHAALPSSVEQKRAPSASRKSTPPAPAKVPEVRAHSVTIPAGKEAGWLVQIGSFTQQDNARRMRDKAGSLGYSAFIAPLTEGTKTIYRVQVGPETEAERAKKLKQELEHRLQVKAFLISPSGG